MEQSKAGEKSGEGEMRRAKESIDFEKGALVKVEITHTQNGTLLFFFPAVPDSLRPAVRI